MNIKEQYELLTQKLIGALPLKAYPTRELIPVFKKNGTPITLTTELNISNVHNSGDISGIVCVVGESKENIIMCGLTYLVFKPASPLFKEIVDYQKKRQKRIMLLHQRGMN